MRLSLIVLVWRFHARARARLNSPPIYAASVRYRIRIQTVCFHRMPRQPSPGLHGERHYRSITKYEATVSGQTAGKYGFGWRKDGRVQFGDSVVCSQQPAMAENGSTSDRSIFR